MSGGNNTTASYDLCWKTDNATVVLNGKSSELVKNAATGAWRLKSDDGSRIEHLNGATNSDNDTEYWRLTTTDGTQYYFGVGRRYATDTANTASTWTVPVFGNQPGEPCHGTTFATSYCAQAWRWNLDYVVDPHHNTMTYFYTAETNTTVATSAACPATPAAVTSAGSSMASAWAARRPQRLRLRCCSECPSGACPQV